MERFADEMWNRKECFCNYQFNVKACSVQGIFKTADVVKNDPDSLSCPTGTVDVMSKSSRSLFRSFCHGFSMYSVEQMIRFPIPTEELTRYHALLPATKPPRPYAFIFGHGLWNDLDLQATLDWLDIILDTTVAAAPWLQSDQLSHEAPGVTGSSVRRFQERGLMQRRGSWPGKRLDGFWPRLFLTPNACGRAKPDEWLVTQGNKALMLFEESVGIEVARRGVEHLGTYNMSVQSNMYDGV